MFVPTTAKCCRTGPRRRGAVIPLVAFLLPVLIILLGFSVDLAYMQSVRSELRVATDIASRSAANELARSDNIQSARNEAKRMALLNSVAGKPLELRDSDITIGRSDPDGSGRWVFQAGGTPPNAVRVEGLRTQGSSGGPVSLFFGAFVGTNTFQPQQTATASFLNVDICLVLDRSSSMKLEADSNQQFISLSDSRFCQPPNSVSRWMALDFAVRSFVQELNQSNAVERVAIVTYFSDMTGGASPPCGASSSPSEINLPLTETLSLVNNEMDTLAARLWNGNTFIEAGMRTGITALTDPNTSRQFAEKVMIVLTDGQENEGSAMAAAPDCAAASITVHTITFGDFADGVTMANVAAAAGGKHYHAPDPATLVDVFRQLSAQVARITD